jgi:hypothetical protein
LGANQDRIRHSVESRADNKKPRNCKFGARARYLRADRRERRKKCQCGFLEAVRGRSFAFR